MKIYSMILLINECEYESVYKFKIPLLRAFGIVSSTLESGNLLLTQDADYFLQDNELIILILKEGELDLISRLNIYYEGIKDYKLLFPRVLDSKDYVHLAERLGEYYHECELAFEKNMWISFILMCGAIFEGLLLFELKKPNASFENLIILAERRHIINDNDKEIMNKARMSRNIIHARRYEEKSYSRYEAVEMNILLNKLIYKLSSEPII